MNNQVELRVLGTESGRHEVGAELHHSQNGEGEEQQQVKAYVSALRHVAIL